MTIACGNGVIEAVAFGGIVEDLVGMTAADFDRLACRHDFVHSLMELHLQSRVFYFGLSGEEKVKTHAYLEKDEMVDSMEPCCVADMQSEERELSFCPFVQLEMVQRVLRLEKKRHCEDGDDEREEVNKKGIACYKGATPLIS
ncbi:hypothetical protein HDU77_001699 [Chytriomyces hyalinus]|nr:hypothetical protein HDU77_001699 [Chytriomyces hyalinus]